MTGSVGFSVVHIRYYERILCDNPACSSGEAIGIGWLYAKDEDEWPVEEYEQNRQYARRSTEESLMLSVEERRDLGIFWGLLDSRGRRRSSNSEHRGSFTNRVVAGLAKTLGRGHKSSSNNKEESNSSSSHKNKWSPFKSSPSLQQRKRGLDRALSAESCSSSTASSTQQSPDDDDVDAWSSQPDDNNNNNKTNNHHHDDDHSASRYEEESMELSILQRADSSHNVNHAAHHTMPSIRESGRRGVFDDAAEKSMELSTLLRADSTRGKRRDDVAEKSMELSGLVRADSTRGRRRNGVFQDSTAEKSMELSGLLCRGDSTRGGRRRTAFQDSTAEKSMELSGLLCRGDSTRRRRTAFQDSTAEKSMELSGLLCRGDSTRRRRNGVFQDSTAEKSMELSGLLCRGDSTVQLSPSRGRSNLSSIHESDSKASLGTLESNRPNLSSIRELEQSKGKLALDVTEEDDCHDNGQVQESLTLPSFMLESGNMDDFLAAGSSAWSLRSGSMAALGAVDQ